MIRQIVFRSCILFFIVILICPGIASARAKVLLIESYHSGYIWDANCIRGLETALNGTADIVSFAMDTKRLDVALYEERADMAWREYQRVRPDVVVLADDNALKYLAARFMSTDTPVVYMGINANPREYVGMNSNITGVLERPLYKRSVILIKQILNMHSGKILVLFDKGTTADVLKDSVFRGRYKSKIAGIEADIMLISSYSEWKKAVLSAKDDGYSAVVVGLFQRIFDGDEHVPGPEVLNWTSQNIRVPMFAFWKMFVGADKAIGGLVLSGEIQGRTAGEMVLKILAGTPINQIPPIIPSQGEFVFSKHELRKWKIRLPYNLMKQAELVD